MTTPATTPATTAPNPAVNTQVAAHTGNIEAPLTTAQATKLYKLVTGKNQDGTPIHQEYSEQDLLKFAQKGYGADAEFRSTKQARDEVNSIIQMMKNPQQLPQILRKLGYDPSQLGLEWYAQQIQENTMDPTAKELRDAKKKLKDYDDEKTAAENTTREAQISEMAAQVKSEIGNKITEALTAAGLPIEKQYVRLVGQYLQLAAKKGYDINQIPIGFLVNKVKADINTFAQTYYGSMSEDHLSTNVDEATLAKYARAHMKKAGLKGSGAKKDAVVSSTASAPAKPVAMSTKAWEAENKKRIAAAQEAWNRQRR